MNGFQPLNICTLHVFFVKYQNNFIIITYVPTKDVSLKAWCGYDIKMKRRFSGMDTYFNCFCRRPILILYTFYIMLLLFRDEIKSVAQLNIV